MADPSLPPNLREFHCVHCNGKIRIPKDLPPTTGPCPHCHGVITSPVAESVAPAAFLPPAPVGDYTPPQQPARPVAPIPSVPELSTPAPAQYTPPYQAPVQEVPAYQPPVQQTPAYQPPAEQTLAYQPPVQAPAQQTLAYQPPAQQTLAYQPPVQQAPTYPAAPQPSPVEQAPAQQAPAEKIPDPKEQSRERISSTKPKAPPEPKKSIVPVLLLTLLLVGFAAAAGYVVYKEMNNRNAVNPLPSNAAPADSSRVENQYIRIGWERDARNVLTKFLAAKTVAEKIPYVLNGEALKSQMESFYGGSVIDDQDTPEIAFSAYQLSESDRKRGIFLMTFEQPPQFEMKEFFRPLAALEVQYGVSEADLLLSTLANVTNFATDPIRVSAFFKKTPQGLKLDWEIFAQSKYRLLETMFEVPEAGQTGVFRVMIEEDVPVKGTENPQTKTYRISDPSSQRTSTRVQVRIDSEIGRTLSEINWIGQQNRPISRTSTVELKWVGTDRPTLELQRLICWEFLHLGGTVNPVAAPSPK